MQFAQPNNLWTLLVLLPMIGAYVGWWLWKTRLMDRVGDRDLLTQMAAAQSARRQVARAAFALVGTALLCIAYAQPQWGQTHRPIKRTGVDVVFALDLSASMNARDVAPNRLEAAKNEIETTLEVLRGDRVGLVVFTAVSFVQTPLTSDYGAIRFYLDKLQTGQMPVSGTSLARPVTDSIELLTGRRLGDDTNKDVTMQRAKNQILVLITDGEDHDSNPETAAQTANENNIRIVTVGLGSPDGEKIPLLRPDGSLAGYKRDKQGTVVTTKLDSTMLKTMADLTGGVFIPYDGENSVANALVDYINRLEQTELETMMKERYRERFQFFAVPGLLLLLLSLLFGERKRAPRSRAKTAVAAAVLIVSGSGCDRMFEDTLSEVDRGNALIAEGEFDAALAAYQAAEKVIPARPELHYNLGRAYLGLEQWDDAAGAFARALETEDISLRFDALNNLGLAHAGRESWSDAWETFTEALTLAASYAGVVDEERLAEARQNLEVAWIKLFPPCRDLEDAHEPNDAAGNATKLEEPKVSDATLCGLNDDWYVVNAIPGSTVSVTAKFRDLRDKPDLENPFLVLPSDVQIALFDHTGETVLSVDQGDDVDPNARTATREIARFTVDETMTTNEAAQLLLKVGAAEHREFKYDLTFESIPPCWVLEEEMEDNDTPEQAKAPGAGTHQMHTCPGDDDWIAVDVEAFGSFFVDVQTAPDQLRERPANLRLEVFGPNDRLVAEGTIEGQYVTAGVRDVPEAGRYLVRIFGDTNDEQGPYTLDIYEYGQCPDSDDRFEENDSATSAAALDTSQPVQRYLRSCDPDFFRIDLSEAKPEDKRVEVGLARVSTPRPDADLTELPQFALDLVDVMEQVIVEGTEPIEPPEPQPLPDGLQAPPPALPIALALQAELEEDEDAAILRVLGEDEFYHLVQLNPSSGGSSDDEQDQDQSDGNQEQDDSENKEDGEQGQEDESSEQEQDGGEEEQPTPNSDENEDASEGDDEQSAWQEEPADSQLQDILQALEATDDNFQMRKALENLPSMYNEKDW